MVAVEIEDLVLRRFGFQLGPLRLLLPAGSRTAVVGPSGSGKTTLLRCLAGFERPDAGTIRIGGALVRGPRTDLPPDRRGIGFVFQDGALWPHLTALQHLQFAAPGLGRAGAQRLLQQGGLGHASRHKPAALSGGEAQRLGLLRALAAAPRLLLLDEPLRSLDRHRRDELVLLLRACTAERAITSLLVTHDRDEALALADHLVVLHNGLVVEAGPAAMLLQQPRTAFTAMFLCGAACLPVPRDGVLTVRTPFGPLPTALAAGDLQLVLLPGDVAVVPASNGGARGTVLSATPTHAGTIARVELAGAVVPAIAQRPLCSGEVVGLQLVRPARLLPVEQTEAPA